MTKSRPRASDAQRTAVLKALDESFSEGKLDHFEHFERTRTATRARLVDELRPLVADLRGGDDDLGLGQDDDDNPDADTGHTADNRHPNRGWAIGISIAVVILAIAGGAIAASVSNNPSNSGSTTEEVGPGPLHTQEGVTRMLDAARSEYAGEDVESLLIWGRFANLSYEDPTSPGQRLTHAFRGEWEESRVDSFTSDRSFDIADVEPADVMAAIDATPEALGLDPEETVTSHVHVSPDPLGDPEFRVSASEGEDGDLGTATFGPDGELREVTMPD